MEEKHLRASSSPPASLPCVTIDLFVQMEARCVFLRSFTNPSHLRKDVDATVWSTGINGHVEESQIIYNHSPGFKSDCKRCWSTLRNCHFQDLFFAQSNAFCFWALRCHLPSSGQGNTWPCTHLPGLLAPLIYFSLLFFGSSSEHSMVKFVTKYGPGNPGVLINPDIPQQERGKRCDCFYI